MISPLPRRRFLKLAIATPIALTAFSQAGCSFWGQSKEEFNIKKTRFGHLLSFSPDEANTLFAFAEGCLTLEPDSILTAKVIPRLDEEFYFVSSYIRDDFRLALSVMEYLPIVYGEFSRFSKLSASERNKFLTGLKETNSDTVRAILHNLRMAVMLTYYGHESTWQEIQYDGPFAQIPPQMSAQRQHYQGLTQA